MHSLGPALKARKGSIHKATSVREQRRGGSKAGTRANTSPRKPTQSSRFNNPTRQSSMPRLPAGIHALAAENDLNLLPPAKPHDRKRPWFMYDYQDPTLGGNSVGEIYQPTFKLTVEGPDNFTFKYRAEDHCTVTVQAIIHSADPSVTPKNLQSPTPAQLGATTSYNIQAGYRRALLCFLREIDLVYKDKVQEPECVFRATYLLKVLDDFMRELWRLDPSKINHQWRSRSLNPLLQRQFHGVEDQDCATVRARVGETPEHAAQFYLARDPLDPDLVSDLLRGLLLVSPVRWSLAHLGKSGTRDSYLAAQRSTQEMVKMRKAMDRKRNRNQDEDASNLCRSEVTAIVREEIHEYFLDLIREARLEDLLPGNNDDSAKLAGEEASSANTNE